MYVFPLNGFRLVADCVHVFAILILIFFLIKKRSCYSISGESIALYTLVFTYRYLDLFTQWSNQNLYMISFKIFFLISHYFLLILIFGIFRQTRDRSEKGLSILAYLIATELLVWFSSFLTEFTYGMEDFFWRRSIFLEVFAIIPQWILINQQGTIGKSMVSYLLMLGSYRALYIVNWIYRYYLELYWDPIAFYSGCFQTLIYLCALIYTYPRINQKKSIEMAVDDDPILSDII